MKLLTDRRVRSHLLFWVLLMVLLFLLNRGRYEDADALAVTALTTLVMAAFFYLNYSWLTDFYLQGKRVLYFSAIAVSLTLGAFALYETQILFPSQFEQRVREQRNQERQRSELETEDEEKTPRHDEKSPRSGRQKSRIRPFLFRFVPGTLFLLITWALSSFVRTADESRKKEKEVAQLKAEQLNTELKLLKSQINPHFLFNALNNIYSLTVTQSENAPDMLLKLSSMLRYVLYEGSEDQVPLSSEIKYIHDYIDLQRLKDEEIDSISFTHTEETSYQISPMLLIPFIENAFKHSKVEDLQQGWIKVDLQVAQGPTLVLTVENSLPDQLETDQTGGIGIENVRRRLELLHGDNYTLDIKRSDRSFRVHLIIPLT